MARRLTTTSLLIAYLASQLVVVPHAHGDSGQPSDHHSRPHAHVSWFTWVGHSHDDRAHDDRAHDDRAHDDRAHDDRGTQHEECEGCRSQPISSELRGEQDGHDSDAVYLGNETGTASLLEKSVISLDGHQFVSMLVIAAAPSTSSTCDCWADAYFPDKCNSGTPLYLTLRSLRL